MAPASPFSTKPTLPYPWDDPGVPSILVVVTLSLTVILSCCSGCCCLLRGAFNSGFSSSNDDSSCERMITWPLMSLRCGSTVVASALNVLLIARFYQLNEIVFLWMNLSILLLCTIAVLVATFFVALHRWGNRSSAKVPIVAACSLALVVWSTLCGTPYTPRFVDPGRRLGSLRESLRTTGRARLMLSLKDVFVGILAMLYIVKVEYIMVGKLVAIAELMAVVFEVVALAEAASRISREMQDAVLYQRQQSQIQSVLTHTRNPFVQV